MGTKREAYRRFKRRWLLAQIEKEQKRLRQGVVLTQTPTIFTCGRKIGKSMLCSDVIWRTVETLCLTFNNCQIQRLEQVLAAYRRCPDEPTLDELFKTLK